VIVLERAPLSLDEHVVGSSHAVHGDRDTSVSQDTRECVGRELGALKDVKASYA
jgi:hypothetical protein